MCFSSRLHFLHGWPYPAPLLEVHSYTPITPKWHPQPVLPPKKSRLICPMANMTSPRRWPLCINLRQDMANKGSVRLPPQPAAVSQAVWVPLGMQLVKLETWESILTPLVLRLHVPSIREDQEPCLQGRLDSTCFSQPTATTEPSQHQIPPARWKWLLARLPASAPVLLL